MITLESFTRVQETMEKAGKINDVKKSLTEKLQQVEKMTSVLRT